jgi:RimJ/RimL family protein N-acetyltransferase
MKADMTPTEKNIELVSPFPIVALPRVWRWVEAHRDRIADDYFAKDLDQFVDDWEVLIRRGRVTWGVMREGVLGGVITSEQKSAIVWDLHCVFSREFWGNATTVPALRLACEQIFAPPPEGFGADKISTEAFADNLSLSRLVKALGGSREGIQHGQTRRGGVLVDVMLLGLQKERFDELRHQSQLKQSGHEPGRLEPVQPGRDLERHDGANPDPGAAPGPDANHAADPRPGDQPRAIPGAGAE